MRPWQGEIDADSLNDALLRYMRCVDEKAATTEAELARRSRMTRPGLHHLHTAVPVLTVLALARWANGRQIDAGFLMWKVGGLSAAADDPALSSRDHARTYQGCLRGSHAAPQASWGHERRRDLPPKAGIVPAAFPGAAAGAQIFVP